MTGQPRLPRGPSALLLASSAHREDATRARKPCNRRSRRRATGIRSPFKPSATHSATRPHAGATEQPRATTQRPHGTAGWPQGTT